jgi:hypothetical protein
MKARVSTNRGAGWASAVSLDTDGLSKASVAALGQRLAVVWTDLNSSGAGAVRLKVWQSGVWQTTRSAGSFSSSATYRLAYDPAVALVGTGGVGVAWTGCRRADCTAPGSIGNDLRWRESSNNGGTWRAAVLLVDSRTTALRRINDAASINWGDATHRYVGFNGYTNVDPFPSAMYQRNGSG